MEYIPDGLTKAQWAKIKKKEEEDKKKKGDMAAMGTKRFKSRSFEAWQKAGGKHLFPVNPNEVPYEERPYMQRKGGDWEGKDLEKKGIFGTGQGAPSKRLAVDDIYEKAKKAGKLDSASIFGGMPLPWTGDAAKKLDNSLKKEDDPKFVKRGVAGRQLSPEEKERLKKNLFKPIVTKKEQDAIDAKQASDDKKKKKGLFGGLF